MQTAFNKKDGEGYMTILNRSQLISLGANDMSFILPIVEQTFLALSSANVLQPAKTTLKYTDQHEKYSGLVNVLPAAIRDGTKEIFGLKALGAMPSNLERGIPRATGVVVLFDGDTKSPRAVLDAQVISAMRTGAVSAVAAKHLCRADSHTLGLIGAGVNMRTQLMGLLQVLNEVNKVKVFSRGPSKTKFVTDMKQRYPSITFIPVDTAEEAAEYADVVVTCVANSDTPVLKKHAINQPGVTVFNIGCLENEPALLKNMDMIVSDMWEYSKHRGVQTHAVAYARGIITDDNVADLRDILLGKVSGRINSNQRIFFCPTGLGVQDIAVAKELYDLSLQRGLGSTVQLWKNEPWV